MSQYENGPLAQYSAFNAGVIPNDVFGVAINWFVNRTPLFSRLNKLPVGSPKFLITNDQYVSRSQLATAAFGDTTGTTLTVGDATVYDIGDVLLIDSEYMQVAALAASATTITVVRGYAGSTAATHANGAAVNLITNARTGAEVDLSSVSRIPATVTQWCQTVQHAYQVGGALQADTNWTTGFATPLDRDRMLALQRCADDFEVGCYYGPGVPLAASSTRPAMFGLQSLIVSNNTSSPTNASAYKPSDLVRDTIQACFNGGGNPSLLLVSTDFLSGLSLWGQAAMRIPAGQNVFGTPIDLFEAPFLNGISIIPAPLLRKGTAVCFSGPEVRIRMKRNLFDKPRGSRGDAFEGDMIMEGAIELDNEAHHAWVSGITGFAAS